MSSGLRAYGGGAATCICSLLPHSQDCPAKPFFEEGEGLTLDSEQEQQDHPFILECPRGHRFLQTTHVLTYDYSPIEGQTEQSELPLVCPSCGASDKQTLPVIVGHNPFEAFENDSSVFEHFKIHCPNSVCPWVGNRTDGVVDIWLEKAVVKGCVSMFFVAHNREYQRGEVYEEYTELSITCPECGHACGEDSE